MDPDQARQFALFGWIISIFIGYPSVFTWATWKCIQYFNAPKGLLLVGLSLGLFLATYHLLLKIRKEDKDHDGK
jgi:hypothetical protein